MRLTPASARPRQLPSWLRRASGPVALVALWHLASVSGVLPSEVLAGPATVLESAAKLIRTGELQDAILVSLRRAMTGLAIGGSIGVALAVIAGLTRWARIWSMRRCRCCARSRTWR